VTIHEVVTGRVEARNPKGILVAGDWRNVSKFAPLELPPIGAMVRLELDAKNFIVTLEVLDQTPPPPRPRMTADEIDQEDTRTHLQVLEAAAHFAATRSDLKSADVLRIADSWLQWILNPTMVDRE